jgi:outer membrane protein assembly factor BamB
VKRPRLLAAGLVLVGFALLASACGGVRNPEGWAGPTVDDSRVYFFTKKDRLAAVTLTSETTADAAWRLPDSTRPEHRDHRFDSVYTTPILYNDALFFASYDERVYSVRASDGAVLWASRERYGAAVVEGLALAGDRLILGTIDGRVYAINTSDGTPAAGWPIGGVRLGESIYSNIVVIGESAYVGTLEGRLYRISVNDGSLEWDAPFEANSPISDLTALDGGRLFVPTLGRRIWVVDAETGEAPLGEFRTSNWVWSGAAYADGVIYFGDFSGQVYALDITGPSYREVWPAAYDAESRIKSTPAVVGDTLVVATREPEVHFISLRDGTLRNRVPLEGAGTVRAPLGELDGAALVVTTRGRIYRANPALGNVQEILVAGEIR